MLNLTDIISKPVLSLSQGKALGSVENIVFDSKLCKMTYLCIFDEEYGDKRYIPSGLVLYACNNSVVVKSAFYFDKEIIENCPLRANVYSYDGKKSGIITDILLADDFTLLYLKDDSGKIIKRQNIVSFSTSAAVTCFDEDKIDKLKRIRPKKPVQKRKKVEDIKESTENIIVIGNCDNSENTNSENMHLRNIVPPYNYLVGRKTIKDIFDDNNKLIIKQNSVITKNIIDLCRRGNSLMILAKNSTKAKVQSNC